MRTLSRVGWILAAIGSAAVAFGVGCSNVADEVSSRVRGSLGGDDGGEGSDAGEGSDGCAPEQGGDGGDSGPAGPACDLSKPFNTPVVVPGFDARDVYSARISADETSALLS